MDEAAVIEIITSAMWTAAKVGAPILLTAMSVGVLVGLFQSITQIQEQTLAFVPKFIAVGLVIVFSGNWMMQELISFTRDIILRIPQYL